MMVLESKASAIRLASRRKEESVSSLGAALEAIRSDLISDAASSRPKSGPRFSERSVSSNPDERGTQSGLHEPR